MTIVRAALAASFLSVLSACDSPSRAAKTEISAEKTSSLLDVAKAAPNALGVGEGAAAEPPSTDTPTTQKVGKLVVTDFDISRANPNLLDPCLFVAKGAWEKAEDKDKFQIEFKATYSSGGRQVTRIQTVHLKDATVHEHPGNPKPDKDKYVPIKSSIDISGQPLDPGSSVTVTAKLYKTELVGESSFTDTAQVHEEGSPLTP